MKRQPERPDHSIEKMGRVVSRNLLTVFFNELDLYNERVAVMLVQSVRQDR